jgi:two-component system LytT family response regulator
VKAIIIDDERLARAELKGLLAIHKEVRVVGEAVNLDEAERLLHSASPDVVFLDVQLGNENGFSLLERIPHAFKVIFVTAFDEYAIRAFEVNALDYLLKPVNPERLRSALDRLSGYSAPRGAVRPLKIDDRILLESDRRSVLVEVAAIQFITAAGDYSEVFIAKQGKLFSGSSMREWEQRLPASGFLRVHRSTIVNLGLIERLEPTFSGGFLLSLHGLTSPIAVSRRHAARLRQELR